MIFAVLMIAIQTTCLSHSTTRMPPQLCQRMSQAWLMAGLEIGVATQAAFTKVEASGTKSVWSSLISASPTLSFTGLQGSLQLSKIQTLVVYLASVLETTLINHRMLCF